MVELGTSGHPEPPAHTAPGDTSSNRGCSVRRGRLAFHSLSASFSAAFTTSRISLSRAYSRIRRSGRGEAWFVSCADRGHDDAPRLLSRSRRYCSRSARLGANGTGGTSGGVYPHRPTKILLVTTANPIRIATVINMA